VIDFLTRSKIKRKIILLFLCNQKREFYLSEIAKIVGTSPGTAQRELNRLLASDFISFKKKANLSIYSLNKRYALLKEVEAIVNKTFGIEVQLKNDLGVIDNIEYAFIFGSFVKGKFRSESDIDLFIIGDVEEDQILKTIENIENSIDREINYHFADKDDFLSKTKDNYFYREILHDYLLLIGNKDEFKKLIEKTHS
jgi:predicted nucleotidyltransferase/DNA-binding transcriptional ArsR family regulator